MLYAAVYESAPASLTGPAVVLLLPATINALVYDAQKFLDILLIVDPKEAPHRDMMNVALLGNPDDVASYLVAPIIAAVAFALIEKRTSLRIAYAGCAILLVLTVLATQRQTATIAVIAGGLAFIGVLRSKKLTMAALGALMIGTAIVALTPGLMSRFRTTVQLVRAGEYDSALTGRITPLVAALEMARDHPIKGVGPGCFKFNYLTYSLKVQERLPRLVLNSQTRGVNYAETHNDHLQVLAEIGIPGYLGAIALLAAFAWISLKRSDSEQSPAARFAKLTAAPIVVSLIFLAGGQFPMEIAAPRTAYIFLVALCARWERP